MVRLSGLRVAAMDMDDRRPGIPRVDSRLYLFFRALRQIGVALRDEPPVIAAVMISLSMNLPQSSEHP